MNHRSISKEEALSSIGRKISLLFLFLAIAIAGRSETEKSNGLLTSEALRGLELRAIGPALMGGRIADIAVSPRDRSTWYMAVGSGGVWKTANAGITWEPIFDDQPSYSIGCIALDPTNPDVVWVGTGENVSGRHVGWGDGVYKSLDGGRRGSKWDSSAPSTSARSWWIPAMVMWSTLPPKDLCGHRVANGESTRPPTVEKPGSRFSPLMTILVSRMWRSTPGIQTCCMRPLTSADVTSGLCWPAALDRESTSPPTRVRVGAG